MDTLNLIMCTELYDNILIYITYTKNYPEKY